MTDSSAGEGGDSLISQIEDEEFMNQIEDEELMNKIKDQERRFSSSIGQGTSRSMIKFAAGVLASAQPHPDFIKFNHIQFTYVKLAGEEADAVVKSVVDNWTQTPGNIQRAASAVGRSVSDMPVDKVKAFCGFRFKELKHRWRPMHGFAVEKRALSVVVIIALEPLNRRKGCFTILRRGEDICVDGKADVLMPGTGGGLCVFMDLNI